MTTTSTRILIVDDNPAIHDDFRKTLVVTTPDSSDLDAMEALLLGTELVSSAPRTLFELVSAMQGQDALRAVIAAKQEERPFALAFVDMRMPPGWDGLETIERIWQVDPEIQIVICSAYSDYTWSDLRTRLGVRESLLILKKPFDTVEVLQCAEALSAKWALARKVRAHVENLEAAVSERTRELSAANLQLAEELERRARIEVELRLAQKLEAVGQLAAGLAHEINTPIQYVGDHLQFVRDSLVELAEATTAMRGAAAASGASSNGVLAEQILAIAAKLELDYLVAELPRSLVSITGGVARVATIVRAMKELAQPGARDAAPVDLADTLRNVAEVTIGTYRGVADLELDLQPMPPVHCHGGEIKQVVLNLIVNAAHAMEGRATRGRLGVKAKVDGADVVVAISDTGCGIPLADRERVFDAFFTTKDVGRGTGQGLAVSRSIIVDRHGGSLTFDSALDAGTTFYLRIPIAGRANQLAA